ncbi:hypothetical protein D3C76_388150 [compost metagenome]
MPGHAPHRQQAALHQHVAGKCQQNRRHAGEQVDVEPVTGEHRRAFSHQAPGHHFQRALVTGGDGRRQCGKRYAINVGQVLYVAEAQWVVHGHGGQYGHVQIARIHLQQRRLPGRADTQQGFAVAEHVLEQRGFAADQLQGVAVVEERAQLIDAGDQRRVITADQFALQVTVQRHAQGRQRDKRQEREHQRQAQRQGVAQMRQAVHGCVSKR